MLLCLIIFQNAKSTSILPANFALKSISSTLRASESILERTSLAGIGFEASGVIFGGLVGSAKKHPSIDVSNLTKLLIFEGFMYFSAISQ